MALLLVASAAVWGLRHSQAQQTAPPSLKIAVVNVAGVLSDCRANLDREKASREKERQIKADLAALSAEADSIRQELENALKPGSSEYQEQLRKWFEKRAQYKAHGEYQQEAFAAETQAWMENLYEKLLAEIAKVAREQGVALVLNKDETTIKPQKLTELTTMILSRKVLYNATNVDLTARLLENMDKSYALEQASK